MATITDTYMHDMLSTMKSYSLVLLRATAKRKGPGADSIVWEHGRRNFALRAEGVLAIVCPVSANCPLSGLCIFNADTERTRQIMDEDPVVKAGIFTYEVYPCESFPGDALPK